MKSENDIEESILESLIEEMTRRRGKKLKPAEPKMISISVESVKSSPLLDRLKKLKK